MKMVFDVESNGLHGEGFAVGWVLINKEGRIISARYEWCKPKGQINPWVKEHVLPLLVRSGGELPNVRAVRDVFWEAWMEAKAQGATLWADWGWPVEANFLTACVKDNPEARSWEGPLPLQEIATVLEVVGKNPDIVRPKDEPEHHPAYDAMHSARILIDALKRRSH